MFQSWELKFRKCGLWEWTSQNANMLKEFCEQLLLLEWVKLWIRKSWFVIRKCFSRKWTWIERITPTTLEYGKTQIRKWIIQTETHFEVLHLSRVASGVKYSIHSKFWGNSGLLLRKMYKKIILKNEIDRLVDKHI